MIIVQSPGDGNVGVFRPSKGKWKPKMVGILICPLGRP